MPPARVSFIHICASAGFFEALRQRTTPVEYAAVTLAANLPSRTALQTRACRVASPDGGIVVGAALVVGLEPGGDFAEAIEVGAAVDVAAEVGEEEAVGLFLFGDGVVLAARARRRGR